MAFSRLFGTNQKKTQKKAPTINESIQQLNQAVNQLGKREAHLAKKIQICVNNAKSKSKKMDKKGAMYELKKKKQLENQLQSIQGKKLNLELQILSLEDAAINKSAIEAMDLARITMQRMVSDSMIDKVDTLTEDLEFEMDKIKEIGNVLSEPLGEIYDDDDLENELALLEEEDLDLGNNMGLQRNKSIEALDDLLGAFTPNQKKDEDDEEEDESVEKQKQALEATMN
eukprot:CAMPEP_0201586558 /NCGR_PEP_ID=MMETSP0190_2-20130828/134000_1 /ASSEMBLY_ACC=CAM_ASM_000263 /TAXON_ID=37353 /ORGANISM="Rosalina sp." /LENGTH=227 /DNA_ID=CAMNT_0048034775 /DNA_START=93 /DNA_END=776 /DNA_ORIENTATION=-